MKTILKRDKHAHWWLDKHGRTDLKWAIQDRSGNWWLVNGSEFPERKLTNKELEGKNIKKKIVKKYDCALIILTCALGVSLAMNLAIFCKIIF